MVTQPCSLKLFWICSACRRCHVLRCFDQVFLLFSEEYRLCTPPSPPSDFYFRSVFPRTLASRVISSNSPNANSFLYAMRTYVFLTIGGSQVFSIQVSSIPKSSFIGFVQLYQIKIQGLFKGFFKTISNFSRNKNYQGWLGHIHCLFFTRRATLHNLEVWKWGSKHSQRGWPKAKLLNNIAVL